MYVRSTLEMGYYCSFNIVMKLEYKHCHEWVNPLISLSAKCYGVNLISESTEFGCEHMTCQRFTDCA